MVAVRGAVDKAVDDTQEDGESDSAKKDGGVGLICRKRYNLYGSWDSRGLESHRQETLVGVTGGHSTTENYRYSGLSA